MGVFGYLFIFDLSAIVLMFFLSHLSKRLGEALKIPPYYKVLYLAAVMVFCGFAIDTLGSKLNLPMQETVSVGLRLAAGVFALAVSLRYWKWLFSEYLKT